MTYSGMGAPLSYRNHARLRLAYDLGLCSDCGIKRARRADLIVELVDIEGLPPLLAAAAVNKLHPEVSVLDTLNTAAFELGELDPVVCKIAERISQDGSVLTYPEIIAASRSLSTKRFTLRPVRSAKTSYLMAVWLSIAILFTQLGDGFSTILGLSLGATESNLIMAKFIRDFGYTQFISLKVVASVFLIWVLWKRPTAAGFIICAYMAIIVNNLLVSLSYL
jgi:hypothetical protein